MPRRYTCVHICPQYTGCESSQTMLVCRWCERVWITTEHQSVVGRADNGQTEFGYYANAGKCWLVMKPDKEETTRSIGQHSLTVPRVSCHLKIHKTTWKRCCIVTFYVQQSSWPLLLSGREDIWSFVYQIFDLDTGEEAGGWLQKIDKPGTRMMDLKGKKMSALSVQDLAQASSVRCLICKKGPTAQVSASCNVWFSVQVISSLTTFWILVTKSNHSIKLYVKCWKVTTYNYCSLQGQLSHGTTYHLLLKQAVCQNKLVVHLLESRKNSENC